MVGCLQALSGDTALAPPACAVLQSCCVCLTPCFPAGMGPGAEPRRAPAAGAPGAQRHLHAQGRHQRGHPRLGDQCGDHTLHPRLGRGAPPLPHDGTCGMAQHNVGVAWHSRRAGVLGVAVGSWVAAWAAPAPVRLAGTTRTFRLPELWPCDSRRQAPGPHLLRAAPAAGSRRLHNQQLPSVCTPPPTEVAHAHAYTCTCAPTRMRLLPSPPPGARLPGRDWAGGA